MSPELKKNMKIKRLYKRIVKWGNASGVLLPKKFIGMDCIVTVKINKKGVRK